MPAAGSCPKLAAASCRWGLTCSQKGPRVMRLYHHPFSSNARRAVITALELNTPIELVLVDLPKREHRQPAFLARNPAGRVPVLEDGSVILPESHAIMLYLVAQAA